MYLRKLRLRNFRNYVDQTFTFCSEVNVFIGANGQGKTNIFDAICLLSTGSALRTQRLEELIRKGSDSFYIEALVQNASMEETLQLSYHKGKKLLQHNASIYSSFTNLLGILPSIFSIPSDLELITGAPLYRRKFLNIHLAQQNPLYTHYLLRYNRAMKQRNALLKQKSLQSIEIWEEEMAASGAYLTWMRNDLLGVLAPLFEEYIAYFSIRKEQADCLFRPSIPLEQTQKAYQQMFAKQLQKQRWKEIQWGVSLSGSHRDDFSFSIDDLSSKKFASEGQKRCIAASMRFAQWEQLSRACSNAVIFCVDDFGLGLDKERKRVFKEKLPSLGQVFLTTAEPLQDLPKTGFRTFFIEKGSLCNVV